MTIQPSAAGEKILVRGVNWLGDAVMTTPALMRLREAHPDAHITLLTPSKLAELWTAHPAIDAVISVGPGETLFQTARRIREGRFDAAVVFPNSPRSALETFFGRVAKRIGLARRWRTWALTKPLTPRPQEVETRKRSASEVGRLVRGQSTKPRDSWPEGAHQILDYLHITAALGANPAPIAPIIAVQPDEVVAARKRFGASEGRPLFGLNPGAEYGPAKRWPVERFAEAARIVFEETNCEWWVFGNAAEMSLAESIFAKLPKGAAQSLAGKTSLRELCAAFKACRLLLTNDTGPMHLAAAVGTPVVVPFGSTSPELTGPGWPPGAGHELLRGQAPCAPCFRRECPIDFRCMTGITVESAAQAVLRIYRRVQK
jgi:ADP-heptose:LPS heptosyltransferase